MVLEALQWNNLVRLTQRVRDRYVNFNDERPGEYCCGEAAVEIGYELFRSLGKANFLKYIICPFLHIIKESIRHSVIVVGEGGKDLEQRFRLGTKLDPTIFQYQQTHPQLRGLNKRCVFTGDYPGIYTGEIEEDIRVYQELARRISGKRVNSSNKAKVLAHL